MKICKYFWVIHLFFIGNLQAQNYDLSGDWVGYVTQEDMVISSGFYEFGLKVTSKGKGNYEGKSYIATDGDNWSAMGEMQFKANWSNDNFSFKETKIIQQKIPQNIEWCLKSCNFQLKIKNDSLIMEGPWTGRSSYGECNPGYIRVAKPLQIKNQNTSKEEEKPLLPEQVKLGEKFQFSAIQFEPSKSYLLSSSYETLDGLADWLKKHPKNIIEIGGHTDKGKNYEYNMTLSQERANAVMNYLVQRGVNPNQLKAKGYGSTKPIANNETVEGRKLNRRVEFIVLQ